VTSDIALQVTPTEEQAIFLLTIPHRIALVLIEPDDEMHAKDLKCSTAEAKKTDL